MSAGSSRTGRSLILLAPLLVFFAAYMASDIYIATGVLMAATVISIVELQAWSYI